MITKLWFEPYKLQSWHKIYHALLKGMVRIAENIEEADIVFNWTDNVYLKPINITGKRVVNNYCTDVSKKNVDRVFSECYGYGTLKEKDNGFAVEKKSNSQGKKDCRLVDLRTAKRRKGFIYQKPFFNVNKKQQNLIEKRVFVFNFIPIFVVEKTKEISNNNICGVVKDISWREIEKHDKRLLKFIRIMGLEFGEIDMINYNGKDYIIDVNNVTGNALFFGVKGKEFEDYWLNVFKTEYINAAK